MRIALGTVRDPEVEAFKEAWGIFSKSIVTDPDEPFSLSTYDVSSSSTAMPLNASELMKVALNRAESLILQLKREKAEADFYVGMESGFHIVDFPGVKRQVFLESWAYVSDGHAGCFGHGGGIYVPPKLAVPIVDRGIAQGIAIERFSQESGSTSQKGPWGILTRDILDQKHSFVIALIAAFAPFYNPKTYA